MPCLVVIMTWTGVCRDSVVCAYFENKHSAIATQRAFRVRLGIPRIVPVPYVNTTKFWIRPLENTEITLSENGLGSPGIVRTAENVRSVKEAIERSPRPTARKRAAPSGMS